MMTNAPDYAAAARNKGPGDRPRPTSVTVLATIGLVVAALSVVCNAVSTLALAAAAGRADANPLAAAVRAEPALYQWHLVATIARLVLGLVLLVACLGALGMRNWGRRLMLAYAVPALLLALADTYMTVRYMVPIIERLAATDPNVQQIAARRHVGIPLKALFDGAYPVLVLIFMSRRHVRDAFARGGGQASGGIVPERAGR
jgi:hypothetical protein